MTAILTAVSVMAFYIEVVLQLSLLFSTGRHDSLEYSLFVFVTCLLVLSVVVTNLASLVLAWRGGHCGDEGRERRTCLALHATQLGLVWRARGVLVKYTRTGFLQLTSLRLVHASLASFPFLVVHARILLLLPAPRQVTALHVLTLGVSLASSAMALCAYTLRHQLHRALLEEGQREEVGHGGGVVRSSRCVGRRGAGFLVMVLGTVLCLGARLGAFTLMSVQHGLWVLLPFGVHFSLYAAVHFGLCRRDTRVSLSRHRGAFGNSAGASVPAANTAVVFPHASFVCQGDVLTDTPTHTPRTSAQVSQVSGRVLNTCAGSGDPCCPEHSDNYCAGVDSDTLGSFSLRPGMSPRVVSVRAHESLESACELQIPDSVLTETYTHHSNTPTHTLTAPPTHPDIYLLNTVTTVPDTLSTTPTQNTSPPHNLIYTHTHPSTYRVWSGVALAYLNTFDLVEKEKDKEEDEEEGAGMLRCRHVLFYTVLLLQNLALTAAWILPSPHGYVLKLSLAVAILAAFLVALLLKFLSCRSGVVGGGGGGEGFTSEVDTPRSTSALNDHQPWRQARAGQDGDTWSMAAVQHHNTTDLVGEGGGKEFLTSIPRDVVVNTSSYSASLSGTPRKGRPRHTRRLHKTNRSRTVTNGLSEAVIREALREQRQLTSVDDPDRHRQREHSHTQRDDWVTMHKTPHHFSTQPNCSLVTEDNQQHLHDFIRRNHSHSSQLAWTTSLELLPDACCFDDPVLASRLVLESLKQRRHSDSRQTSKAMMHEHGGRCSSGMRTLAASRQPSSTSKEVSLELDLRTADHGRDPKVSGTRRNKVSGCGSPHQDMDNALPQYRYVTRTCACWGSPSSTPRRRPERHPHERKTHSYVSSAQHRHFHHESRRGRSSSIGQQGLDRHNAKGHTSRASGPNSQHTSHASGHNSKPHVTTNTEGEEYRWAHNVTLLLKPPREPPRPSWPVPLGQATVVTASGARSVPIPIDSRPPRRPRSGPNYHRHGRDNSERAASWPRKDDRDSRVDSSRIRKTRLALPQDTVNGQDVVRLWLKGLEPADDGSEDPCDEPRSVTTDVNGRFQFEVCGARASATSSDCDSSGSSLSVELDDDEEEEDTDDSEDDDDVDMFVSANQSCKLSVSGVSRQTLEQVTQNYSGTNRFQTTLQEERSCIAGGPHSHNSGKRLGQGHRSGLKTDSWSVVNKTSPRHRAACPLPGVEQTSVVSHTRSHTRYPSGLGTLLPVEHPHDISRSTEPPHDFHMHDLHAGTSSKRSKVVGHVPGVLSTLDLQRDIPPPFVADSGVSLSTAQDSDGSRSNGKVRASPIGRAHIWGAKISDLSMNSRCFFKAGDQDENVSKSYLFLAARKEDDVQQVQTNSLDADENRNVILDADESLV